MSIIHAQMKVFTLSLIFPFLIEISYYPVLRLVKNNQATGSIIIKRYTIPATQIKIALKYFNQHSNTSFKKAALVSSLICFMF